VSPPRLLVPGVSPDHEPVALPREAAHRISKVLRMASGSVVRVFDGCGHEYEATVEPARGRQTEVRVVRQVVPRPESPLHLVLALPSPKADRMDWVLQKGTELGVTAFWPIVSARSEPCARGASSPARVERWRRVLVSAVEQCGRATLPTIAPLLSIADLFSRPFAGLRLFCTTTVDPQPAWPELPSGNSSALVLVGPAGGWDPAEVDRAHEVGFQPISLGPRVLRSDTAAVTAAALAQFVWGDLGCG
jgi:16S rRNA (uracil1498-N3)-methyltransferase